MAATSKLCPGEFASAGVDFPTNLPTSSIKYYRHPFGNHPVHMQALNPEGHPVHMQALNPEVPAIWDRAITKRRMVIVIFLRRLSLQTPVRSVN
ncbi:hypothetical protein PS2_025851 [Malus domestica]